MLRTCRTLAVFFVAGLDRVVSPGVRCLPAFTVLELLAIELIGAVVLWLWMARFVGGDSSQARSFCWSRGGVRRYYYLEYENGSAHERRRQLMSDPKNSPFDAPMSDIQAGIVANLSESDLEVIDSLLLENIGDSWMKSAFVIGGVMLKVPDEYEELPDVFYSSRLMALEKEGAIKVKGDLRKMKHCDIQRS